MASPHRPAMSDVAKLAGVSHQTVSRVLNGHPSVRDSTRRRVLEAVEALDYRPNVAARALASRRSGVIGVLAMETKLLGPAATLYFIERAARSAGFFLSIATVHGSASDAISEAVDHLILQGVEGVVAIAPVDGAVAALSAIPPDLSVVVVEGDEGAGRSVVSVDQVGGAELVTEHLLDEGAPTVWHIAGPDNWLEARARIRGWRGVLDARGRAAPEVLSGDWSAASGYVVGQQLAERGDVRAVFAGNDQMALGALRAFHERGMRVPDDILVAGFDDTPESAYFTPPLTTVRQNFAAVGQHAIELLLRQVRSMPTEPTKLVVPVDFVPRESTIGRHRT